STTVFCLSRPLSAIWLRVHWLVLQVARTLRYTCASERVYSPFPALSSATQFYCRDRLWSCTRDLIVSALRVSTHHYHCLRLHWYDRSWPLRDVALCYTSG